MPPLGPALPPGFQTRPTRNLSNTSSGTVAESPTVAKPVIGPTLPPGFLQSPGSDDGSDDNATQTSDGVSEALGPALPPGFNNKTENATRVLGPSLPPDLARRLSQAERSADDIGPVLPSGFCNEPTYGGDSGDDMIGPLPPSSDQKSEYSAAIEFEERSLRMREKLLNIVSKQSAVNNVSKLVVLITFNGVSFKHVTQCFAQIHKIMIGSSVRIVRIQYGFWPFLR